MKYGRLQVFVGKVCTVMTVGTGLHITDPVRHAQFFTGRVKEVDDLGIWVEHVQTKAMSYFFFPVVGIVEEQFIPEDDPRTEKLETLKKQAAEAKRPPQAAYRLPATGSFTSIEELTKKVKENRDKV